MAQVLHQRAKTTHAIRKDIQRSSASVAALSRRYNLNPKTVRKWRHRTSVQDERMGPKQPSPTSLSPLEEAAAVTFRRTTLLPLKEATIRSFHYTTLEEPSSHLKDYLWAYNSARPLRTLKDKTPVGSILERWQDEPKRFHKDLVHCFPGPYT